jgi:tetratricopeptide (TPR) repeat protein
MPPTINKEEKIPESYYAEGLSFNRINMLGPAIKSFKKCIEYKEIDSHKACYNLAKIYIKLKDYSAAYEYCTEAIILKPNYIEALYYIAHILKVIKTPLNELKKRITSFFSSIPFDYTIIADIFYMEGYYEIALEYINKYEASNVITDNIELFKVKCLMRCSRYDKCIQFINTISEDNLYFFKVMMYKIICLVLINKYEVIWKITNRFGYGRLNNYNKKVLSVYMQFYNLIIESDTSILCEDENDLTYTSCIFEIYDILLVNKEFDCFERALELLNLISDKSVLLQLGKLYYKYGYIELSKKEIIRSMKLFNVMDSEGLDILVL